MARSNPELDLKYDTAPHLFFRGALAQARGRFEEALEKLEESMDLYHDFLPEDDLKIADVLFQMGLLYMDRKERVHARTCFTRAADIRTEKLPANHQQVWTVKLALAMCQRDASTQMQSLAEATFSILQDPNIAALVYQGIQLQIHVARKDWSAAEKAYRNILPALNRRFGQSEPVSLMVNGHFCGILFERGKYREAFELIMPTLAVAKRLEPNHHQVLDATKKLAFEFFLAHRFQEAEDFYRELIQSEAYAGRTLAEIHLALADVLLQAQRFPECEKALKAWRDDSERLEHKAWRLTIEAELADGLGRTAQAKQLKQMAHETVGKINKSYQAPVWLSRFANACRNVGDWEQGEELFRQALQVELDARPEKHPRIADRCFELAALLIEKPPTDASSFKQRMKESISLLEQALEIRILRLPVDDLRIKETREKLLDAKRRVADKKNESD